MRPGPDKSGSLGKIHSVAPHLIRSHSDTKRTDTPSLEHLHRSVTDDHEIFTVAVTFGNNSLYNDLFRISYLIPPGTMNATVEPFGIAERFRFFAEGCFFLGFLS